MPAADLPADQGLELRNVSKYFGDLVALKAIRFRVRRGESVLVYGPNGAGKTTLLKILAALVRPNEGQVFFDNRNIHRDPAAGKAAVGFTSHATFLYGDLTAKENLEFFGTLFGLRELPKKVDAALDLFGVRDRAGTKVRELSRGLQQRVALARAFLHDPDFLLLDEPFTGLDAAATRNLQALLARLPERGKALVFSTHDFNQGAQIAERLVALEKGAVRYDGAIRDGPLENLGITRRA